MNYTHSDFYTLFETLEILYLVVLSVIILLGITGNGLVIWFVLFRMKKMVNFVWFLSLALADFTFCLILSLTVTERTLGYWPFGTFMCKVNLLALYLNMSASVLQLTVISIDRCISVVFPVWCRNHRTPRLAIKVVLAVWIVSFLFNIPYFINSNVVIFNKFMYCVVDWSLEDLPGGSAQTTNCLLETEVIATNKRCSSTPEGSVPVTWPPP
uniref:G-protein coupled receptors family 1 profile domain-containing protein n=1 Tax=Pyxicephalus adspersus TaxID=30357 RepID=A0AAV2ZPC5_PYXAD|nr:TPA: hypothetical protein GDO54_003288 [Pyxicephalus adspersus]